jgi:hypothetical protein
VFNEKELMFIIKSFKNSQLQGIDNMRTAISIVDKCETMISKTSKIGGVRDVK